MRPESTTELKPGHHSSVCTAAPFPAPTDSHTLTPRSVCTRTHIYSHTPAHTHTCRHSLIHTGTYTPRGSAECKQIPTPSLTAYPHSLSHNTSHTATQHTLSFAHPHARIHTSTVMLTLTHSLAHSCHTCPSTTGTESGSETAPTPLTAQKCPAQAKRLPEALSPGSSPSDSALLLSFPPRPQVRARPAHGPFCSTFQPLIVPQHLPSRDTELGQSRGAAPCALRRFPRAPRHPESSRAVPAVLPATTRGQPLITCLGLPVNSPIFSSKTGENKSKSEMRCAYVCTCKCKCVRMRVHLPTRARVCCVHAHVWACRCVHACVSVCMRDKSVQPG